MSDMTCVRGRDRTGANRHHPIDQGFCQNGSQSDAHREWRLPPRLSSRARPTRWRERTSHHSVCTENLIRVDDV